MFETICKISRWTGVPIDEFAKSSFVAEISEGTKPKAPLSRFVAIAAARCNHDYQLGRVSFDDFNGALSDLIKSAEIKKGKIKW